MIHYREAALDAVVAHLTTQFAAAALVVPVTREWGTNTEAERIARSTAAAFVVVSGGRPAERKGRPYVVSLTGGYAISAIAAWTMNGQVDVFSDTRETRDSVADAVRGFLSPSDDHPRLILTSTTHYSDRVSWDVLAGPTASNDGPPLGEWRATLEVRARGNVLVRRAAVEAVRFDATSTIADIDQTVSTVPAAE